MSNRALTWARALDSEWNLLPAKVDQVKAAALLRVLCDAANDDLLVWLSAETIAQRSRIRSRNTIAKYLGHLESIALIRDTGERRSAGRSTGGAKCFVILVDPGDCSLQSEQTPASEIAHSRVNKLPGEFAQSGPEFAQSGGRVCSKWIEHEAGSLREKQQHARARVREAAAAVSAIEVGDWTPPDDLIDRLSEDRPDLDLADVVAGFRRHTWRRRRTPTEWATEFRAWCEREAAPDTTAVPARSSSAWVRERLRTLCTLPDAALLDQLAADPAMAAVFEGTGGRPDRFSFEHCLALYTAAGRQRQGPQSMPGRPDERQRWRAVK